MKKIFVILSSIIVFGFESSCSTNSQKSATTTHFKKNEKISSSELYIPEKIKDLGKIIKDTILSNKYALVNKGTDSIAIKEIIPDCICTGYKLSKKIVPPGDTSILTLSLDTKEKYGLTKLYATIETDTETKFYRVGLILNKEYKVK